MAAAAHTREDIRDALRRRHGTDPTWTLR